MSEGGQAIVNAALLGLGLLLLSAGGVGLFALWHRHGRDPHAGLIADLLTAPPDDLPPGAAGALLDERADHRDVVATLADLGRRGVVTVDEKPDRDGGRREFALTLVDAAATLAPFERAMLRALFGPDPTPKATALLGQVQESFARASRDVKAKLYAELVARDYFPRSPEATRRRWRKIGFALLAAAIVLGAVEVLEFGSFAWFPAIVAVALALILVVMSARMPRKTRAGAEAAARWRAFRRHLVELERRAGLPEAAGLFDRYLPYAVAFELDRSWVVAFTRAGVDTPGWYHATIGGAHQPALRRGDGQASGSPLDGVDVPLPRVGGGMTLGDLPSVGLPSLPDLPDVDLQGASDLLGGAAQGASDGLLSLFDVAGSIFDSIDFDLDF